MKKESLKMLFALTILSASSGLILAAVRDQTRERIKYQRLEYEKAPAIRRILGKVSNDPLSDHFEIKEDDQTIECFVGCYDGHPETVVFEFFAAGYEGNLGLMIGVNLETDKIIGVQITTHSETPGIGSRVKTDEEFLGQFKNLRLKNVFRVRADGGQIDALSGATITSRGVCTAASKASKIYRRLRPVLQEKIKQYKQRIESKNP
jgi:electron transport complex protein RnfG